MINKEDLNNALDFDKLKDKEKEEQELKALANEVIDKLETLENVSEFIKILKALMLVKGLIL
mgnify:FL=1